MVLRAVYAQKILGVMDVTQIVVRIMIFVKIKNVRLQRNCPTEFDVKKLVKKGY